MGNTCSSICSDPQNSNFAPIADTCCCYQINPVVLSPHQLILQKLNSLPPIDIDLSRYSQCVQQAPMKQKNLGYVYEGTWRGTLVEGMGKIYFPDEKYFQGEFQNGQANGIGRLMSPEGQYFQGLVKDNVASGFGKFSSSDLQFEGLWQNSKPSIGKYRLPQSNTEIQLRNINQGIIKWQNGNFYTGQIKSFQPNGKGVLKLFDDSSYEGDWKNGYFQGYGIFKWPDGKVYKGYYECGEKNGEGQLQYSSSRRYVGSWKNGKMHGFGKIIENDQIIYQGNFLNGVLNSGPISNISMRSEFQKVPVQLLQEVDEFTGSGIRVSE